MKSTILIVCLFLSGCQSYFDDQQAAVDKANAARDHAWCVDVGIERDDPRYAVCRAYARDARLTGAAINDARALGLLGIGAAALPDRPPAFTCRKTAVGVTCY